MNIDFNQLLSFITVHNIIRLLTITITVGVLGMLLIYSWTSLRKINLLNRIITTPQRNLLVIMGLLYFMAVVGTLVLVLQTWIRPLI